jgi:hypothetical protein
MAVLNVDMKGKALLFKWRLFPGCCSADREGPALRYLITVIVASHRTGSVGSLVTQVRRTLSVLVAVMVWLN